MDIDMHFLLQNAYNTEIVLSTPYKIYTKVKDPKATHTRILYVFETWMFTLIPRIGEPIYLVF